MFESLEMLPKIVAKQTLIIAKTVILINAFISNIFIINEFFKKNNQYLDIKKNVFDSVLNNVLYKKKVFFYLENKKPPKYYIRTILNEFFEIFTKCF